MKPELIVFDLAGTTVEDNHDVERILQVVLHKYGVGITDQEAIDVMGIPKPIAIETLLKKHHYKNISKSLVDDIHRHFQLDMITFYRESSTVKEKAGASSVFAKLREANIKVAVDTGFDRKITNVLLDRLGWIENGLIDASITSDEVKQGRPYPDMIFELMKSFSISDAVNVAKVGDTVSDIQEGKSAGCGWVVGITSGAQSRADLIKESPSLLIESLDEILSIIQ